MLVEPPVADPLTAVSVFTRWCPSGDELTPAGAGFLSLGELAYPYPYPYP
ncbi:MAG: hypothetical protein M3474_01810 [Actinomycetota bacterium]|nr:hypothetical protein [Actinomycetota bacterium]